MKFKCGAFQGDPSTVGLWHLDGNSKDSSGHGNNGTDTNVTYGTQYGIFGQGGYYNGSAYTTIPDNAALSPATMTLAVWMNPTSIPSNNFNRIIDKRNGNYGWHFGIKTDGGYNGLYWEAGNGSSISTWIWNYSLSINTWYFVVFTQTGTTVNLYVNGVNAGTPALSGSTGIANASGEPLYFGKGTDGGQYSGYCDDVSIFSRALSTSEIAQMYTAGMTKHTTGRNFAGKILALLATTINFSETVSNSDTFLKGLYRTFSEAVTNSDIFQSLKILSYQFVEAVQSTDTLLRTIGKNFSEAITNSDSLLKSISKGFSEAVTNSDTFSKMRSLVLNFIETIQNTDWLFLNGQLVDRWLRRVHGTISWTKRTIGSIAWINRNKPKP